MMPGMIMLWSGTVATIPSGWTLCDGTMGTPNLKNRFIIGADHDSAGVAKSFIKGVLLQSGGDKEHVHDFVGDGHSHDLNVGNEIENNTPDGDFDHHTSSEPASGTTDNTYHFPQCWSLCYIMKL